MQAHDREPKYPVQHGANETVGTISYFVIWFHLDSQPKAR